MRAWIAQFTGRKVGAIGITYTITVKVFGENKEAAELALYDNYEHITNLVLMQGPMVESVKAEFLD